MHCHSHLFIQNLNYILPSGEFLFKDLSFNLTHLKTGLIGRNGTGKSTLLKLIIGELQPHSGKIHSPNLISYIPQNPIIDPNITIANFLGFEKKLAALNEIQQGNLNEENYQILNEDWNVHESINNQLALFNLNYLPFDHLLKNMSGGELTRLYLIKAFYSNSELLILDEPTNHLDLKNKKILYRLINDWKKGLLIVSHDRTLLNWMEQIAELSTLGLNLYGGNFDFYQEQKEIELAANQQKLEEAQHFLQKTKQSIQSNKEKHEQRQAHGQQLRRSGSQSKLILDGMKERSTRSQGESATRHQKMLGNANEKLMQAKSKIEMTNKIDIELPNTYVPNGKIILEIETLNFKFDTQGDFIFKDFNFKIQGPERIALLGNNGSGKTTLIKLILGILKPLSGKIFIGTSYVRYLDQICSILNSEKSLLDNFIDLNPESTVNHAHQVLAQFLFKNSTTHKLVSNLSGGEKLRAALACVLFSKTPPQLLILDEPTNHLDIDNLKSIESALAAYQGAIIVISHDESFLENLCINRFLNL